MSNVMRVAKTLAHGRDMAQMAEDAPHLRDVRDAFDRLLKKVEEARCFVWSERGISMLTELEAGLGDLNHDACVHTTADMATEAAQVVGVRLVVRS